MGHVVEVAVETFQQLGVSFVRKMIFANACRASSVKVFVGELELILIGALKKLFVAPDGVVETGEEHLFGGFRRNFERECSKRSDLRNQAEEKRQEPGSWSGSRVLVVPIFLIGGYRNAIHVAAAVHSSLQFLNVFLLGGPSRLGHFRNSLTDGEAVGA